MRKKIVSGVLVVGALMGTLSFQNCGTYQPNDNASFLSLSECTGTACIVSPNSILLAVQNSDPTILRKAAPTESEVDVSGFCDNGGYSSTKIDWALTTDVNDPSKIIQSGNGGACDQLGRFQFKVSYPANQPNGVILLVALYGLEGSQKIINPTQQHFKYFRLIQM